jgi:hypothetical protein
LVSKERTTSLERLHHLHIGNKNRDDVETPTELYAVLDATHHFTFDPCPLCCTAFDGLAIDWGQCNYVNPPYTHTDRWLRKAVEQLQLGRKSVCLIPSRPFTDYWFEWVWPYASYVEVFNGGVQFNGYKRKSPFGMCVVVYDPSVPPARHVEQHPYQKRRCVRL